MLNPRGRPEHAADHPGGITARPVPTIIPIRLQPGVDPLDGFKPESAGPDTDPLDRFTRVNAPQSGASRAAGQRAGKSRAIKSRVITSDVVAGFVLAAIAVLVTGFLYARGWQGGPGVDSGLSSSGRVVLNSRPAGATVLVDGIERGATPLELDLPIGSHDVRFQAGKSERQLTIAVEAGTRTSETIDLPPASSEEKTIPTPEAASVPQMAAAGAAPAPESHEPRQPALAAAQLEVTSEPSGARVSVDGSFAGTTPLTLRGVAPARHAVMVSLGSAVVNQSIDVRSGATARVFASLSQGLDKTAGWFIVESPVELRIIEDGQPLGLSSAPLTLRAGRHQIELANDETELRVTVTVQIDPGRPTRLSVPLPTGTLSLNATPWAEVFLDGRSLGETPLGNVQVPAGRHDLVWRHPELGVKRSTVIVGARTPARASMDF